MNKGQGVFAGAVLAAALLLRPYGANPPSGSELPKMSPTLTESSAGGGARPGPVRDGPWLASCRYWASIRPASEDDPDENGNGRHRLPEDEIADAIRGLNKSPKDPGCRNDAKNEKRWGFPDTKAKNQPVPDVTGIIAIVRDPVHTHLALGFDRSIQVLLRPPPIQST